MNFKRLLICLSLIIPLTGCSYGSGHEHQWGSYIDNGDGTHIRTCLADTSHTETGEHVWSFELVDEPTDVTPGRYLYTCDLCNYSEFRYIDPTGGHIFDKEVASEEYLYEKCSDHSSIYFKSCECGAFGDERYLFEKSDIPSEYTELSYIEATGTQYIDTGVEKSDSNYAVKNLKRDYVLPENYAELTYIEATGTQYIDTGIKQSPALSGKLIFSMTSIETAGIIGSATDEINGNILYSYTYDSELHFSCHSTSFGSSIKMIETDLNKHTFSFDYSVAGGGVFLDDVYYPNTGKADSCPITLTLCGSNRSASKSVVDYAHMRINYCEFYENDVLVRKYIPAKEKETSLIGLYDLVNGKFYTSQTSEGFVAGDPVFPSSTLPAEYQEVEYIKSTGTQYIDLDWATISGMYLEYTASSSSSGCLIGSHSINDPYGRNQFYYDFERTFIELGYGDLCLQTTEYNYIAGKVYNFEVSTLSGNAYGKIDGETIVSSTEAQSTSNTNVMVFANVYGLSHSSVTTVGTLYNAKIYDSSLVLVRDLVPCYRKEDLRTGVYDTVSRTFFDSETEDNFEVGPDVDVSYEGEYIYHKYDLPTGFKQVSYIEGNGNQLIDTGYVPSNNTEIKMTWSATSLKNNGFFAYGVSQKVDEKIIDAFCLYPWDGKLHVVIGDESFDVCSSPIGNAIVTTTQSSSHFSMKFNGVTYEKDYSSNEFTSPNNLALGALNRDYKLFMPNSTYRIYECYIYDNNEEIRHYIPVFEEKTGKYGLYDIVNKTFTSGTLGEYVGGGCEVDINSKNYCVCFDNNYGIQSLKSERIYSYKVYSTNNSIIRDYIPVIRESDHVVGLYDLVEKKFYAPTSGTFVAGERVGHIFDEGTITKMPTYNETGLIEYTCSIDGHKSYDVIPKMSFKVTFHNNTSNELRIYSSPDISIYEVTDFVYTRCMYTFNHSMVAGVVLFSLEGTEPFEINIGNLSIEEVADGVWAVYGFTSDYDIYIN